jgi:hypothetical protein
LPEVDLDIRENAPLIAAGGGVLLFISLFLKWFGAEGFDETVSAWEYYDLIDIILAAIALIVAGIGAMLVTGNAANLPASPGAIVSTASLIAFTIVAANILDVPLEGIERKFGLFVALIATIAMLVGGSQLGAGAPPRTRVQEPAAPPPPPPPPPASPTV